MSTEAPSAEPEDFERPGTQARLFMAPIDTASLTTSQAGFINSTRVLEDDLRYTPLDGQQLKATVAELFPPATLFASELLALPLFHRQLRSWLDKRGANMTQHSSRRVLLTLATSLYDEAEDRGVAEELAKKVMADSRRGPDTNRTHHAPQPLSASSSNVRPSDVGSGIAHKIAMRFKDDKSKFSGALGQFFHDYVSDYLQAARDYDLLPIQKLQFMHNIFTGDAKRYYYERIEGYASGFNQAVDMINDEYNSPVRQNRCKNYLSTMRIARYVKEGVEVSEALGKVYKAITKPGPQVPQFHRGEAHRVEFLRTAVIGYAWAVEPLSRIATHLLGFQQLYGELESALHLFKESEAARVRDEVAGFATVKHEVPAIMYQSQGRYLQRHAGLSSRSKPSYQRQDAKMKDYTDPLRVMGCFNCQDPNHVLSNCTKPLNMAQATKNRLEYYSKKRQKQNATSQVLYELCSQLQSTEEGNSDTEVMLATGQKKDLKDDDDELAQSIFTIASDATEHADEYSRSYSNGIVDEEIYACSSEELQDFTQRPSVDFNGACIDCGAQGSVGGELQARAFCRQTGKEYVLDLSEQHRRFKFGDRAQNSKGTLEFRIPTGQNYFISIIASVVDINVPLLLGLDILESYKLIIDVAGRLLISKNQGWKLNLVRKLGHLYCVWTTDVLYTTNELRKMHRHFFHAHPDRIFSLLKRADDPHATAKTAKDLKKITSACAICQKLASAPGRFRVSLPSEDIVFNRTVYIDLMYLDGKPVLPIVDRDTHFSAAAFLSHGESTEDIWHIYMERWVIPYVGYSTEIHVDQGPQFTSERWRSLLSAAGIRMKHSGVESHNALGLGERYHSFLRQIYRKVRSQFSSISKEYALSLSVKSMNETAGQNGLCPVLLAFGVLPRMPLSTIDLPKQRDRMKALQLARLEMSKQVAKARLSTARNSNVCAASDSEIKAGNRVLVYREELRQWLGPYDALNSDQKQVSVAIGGAQKLFSTDKVKLYNEPWSGVPVTADEDQRAEPQTSELGSIFDNIIGSSVFFVRLKDNIMREIQSAEIAERNSTVLLTDIMKTGDRREDTKRFDEAKQKEIDGLIARGTFCPVRSEEVPLDANILSGRFVCTIKNVGTQNERPKARYVAQGHKDKEKPFIVHNITTLRQSSVRIIVSTAAVRNFRLFSHDVTQAYLQSDKKMSRDIYLRRKQHDQKYFRVTSNVLLKILRALYGVTGSGDYWSVIYDRHIKHDLEMIPTQIDPSLYIKEGQKDTNGILGSYVDDSLLCGDENFQSSTEKTLQRFESRPRQWDEIDFLGTHISTSYAPSGRELLISQPEYVAKATLVPLDVSFDKFRSIRASFGWFAHTRPDVCCVIDRAAQVTAETFQTRHIEELNKAIRHVRNMPSLGLRYEALNRGSLHLRCYTDASFASNDDLSSQLGFVILLCDAEDRCHILDYSSRKCKRVVRSIMGGGVYAFAEGFDSVYTVKHTLEKIYRQSLAVTMLTDSKQMFHVITRASYTSEKRLMIDVAAVREAYNRHDISNVGLVLSEHNVADGLTKTHYCKALLDVMLSGYDKHPVQQWIFRS